MNATLANAGMQYATLVLDQPESGSTSYGDII
jgi:hypothetical protein